MTARDACDSQTNDFQHLNSTGLHLPLYHPRSPCSPSPVLLPSDLPLSTIIAHDAARLARFTRDNNLSASLAATAPLARGASDDLGAYLTRLGLGTPPTGYNLIIDTGSSFSWLQCSPCQVQCHPQTDPIFDPRRSSTYATLPCSAPLCGQLEAATLLPSRCSKSSICVYDVLYTDNSSSAGYLSKDTLYFGSSSFPGFLYGCGIDQRGPLGRSAGLIGLSRNKLSLFSQLAPALGSSLSFCLPTSTSPSGGYLSIGRGPSKPGQYSYTPMVSGSSAYDPNVYFIAFTGMSVGGKPLAVPFSAYISLPTIIDSGSFYTYLPPAVYAALSKAMIAAFAMVGVPRVGPPPDTCFTGQASKLRMPAVTMEFAGGVTLKLAPRNVLLDVDGYTTCLAFQPADSTTIIGSTQLQTFSVVFDVGRSRIGFAPGGCN